jgi:hypothetical protein
MSGLAWTPTIVPPNAARFVLLHKIKHMLEKVSSGAEGNVIRFEAGA